MSNGFELLTTTEMAEADRLTAEAGIPTLTLMENAGRAVAEEAMLMMGTGRRIAVLCGPGNNGGDGYVAARLLAERGYEVTVASLVPVSGLRGDAAAMANAWHGPILPLLPEPAVQQDVHIFGLPDFIGEADLVIDAIFGAGLSRPIEGALHRLAMMLAAAGDRGLQCLAVDVPSGLHGNTGASLDAKGTTVGTVIPATRTVTFFRRKPGHVLLPGRALCGSVALYDIGIAPDVLRHIAPRAWANAPGLWSSLLPRLSIDGHKYTRGHAVVASGNIEMSGAARLCARGALRMGAGLVTVASPPDALQAHAAQLNATLLKAASEPGELTALLTDPRYTVVAIGPGLGRNSGSLERVMAVLASRAAAVIDADALTVAATRMDEFILAVRAHTNRPVVLTPHEGEFKRLFPDLVGSKLERARTAAARASAIVILKGPDTVIAAPDGRAAINENAPPTLATAGSGDVLAGFVTGLLAQGMPAFEAACSAVWMHGECARAHGPGLIAEDLPELLPRVLARLVEG